MQKPFEKKFRRVCAPPRRIPSCARFEEGSAYCIPKHFVLFELSDAVSTTWPRPKPVLRPKRGARASIPIMLVKFLLPKNHIHKLRRVYQLKVVCSP